MAVAEGTGSSRILPPFRPAANGLPGTGAVSLWLKLLNIGPLLILILLAAVITCSPNFLKPGNLSNILAQTAVIAIVAVGRHLVILTRGIDLSVGANLALATVIGGLVFRLVDSAPLVALAMILTGAAVGAINGCVYVFGRLPHAFIITLATLSICRGLALELSIGHTTMRGMPDAIATIGGASTLGIPNSFFVVFAVAGLVLLMAKAMVWGRWIYAVGGEPQAALQMGIPVKGVLISTYVISGLCAGIGAVVLAGRTAAASPLYGNLLELDTIAAVIIGGASFLGGRGHIGHALVGAVMIGVIRNALNLLGVDVFFQMIAIGLIIVLAVEADVLRNHLEARARPRRKGPMSAPVLVVRHAQSASAPCMPSGMSPRHIAARCWRCSARTEPASRRW
jgi:ribose transport system permease protein